MPSIFVGSVHVTLCIFNASISVQIAPPKKIYIVSYAIVAVSKARLSTLIAREKEVITN